MGDGCAKPPPPATDPNGSATKPYQFCGNTVPEPQLEKGLPILPVRYALVPTLLKSRPDPIYRITKTLNQFTELPASGHRYTLRVLRRGFVHVYLGTAGKWQIYDVDARGYLRRLTNLDAPEQTSDRTLAPALTGEDHNVPASFVYIPARYSKVWIAFSETHWTGAVRSAMEKNPGARMQALDIKALAAAPDAHPDAFELTEKAAMLSALVDEYAVSEDEYVRRTTYKAFNVTTETLDDYRWDSAFGLHGRGGQFASLGAYAKAYADKAKESLKQARKVPVVALMDPVGMLKEANQTRLHFVAAKQSYCESVMRPLVIAQSINGLEKIIRDSMFKQLEEEEKKKGLPDVQQHYTPAYGADMIDLGGFYETDTRKERAKANADPVWHRLANRLRPGAKEAFEAKYKENIKSFDSWILRGDSAWATWAENPAWLTWFDDYDTEVEAKRAELLENKAACLAGGVTDIKSAAVWKKWLATKPFDPMNPVYRALFGDRKSLLEFLTPGEDGALNKTDKLYDSLKSLISSKQAPLVAQMTKAAAAEIGLAITGATTALGEDVSVASRAVAMRAQQAMLMLYESAEVTMLKVQTTVGEYQRWLTDAAFKRMRAFDRAVQGVLKQGERVVKSAVVGGVMSIRDPKIRDQVIDVILWTFDKIDDIKSQLDKFGNKASTATSTIRGTLEGAAGEVMHTIRVASATLNHEAARLLGAAEGRLALATNRLRGFADSMFKRISRLAGGGEVLLAAGAVFFQWWAASEGIREVDSKLGKLSSEAQLGVLSASIGVVGAVTELTGAAMKRFGGIMWGGIIAAFASVVDSVQASFAAKRTYRNGDYDATVGYTAAALFFAGGAAVGTYAAIIGSSSLLGPFGIALGLVVVGVIALWAAMNAEDTIAEIWMDRCYFGRGQRGEKPWTDAQSVEELEHLNAIVVGLGAQVGFNDNFLGVSEIFSGYDTVDVQVTFGDYDASRSAYEWTLWVHHKDGRKLEVMRRQAGLLEEPQRPVITASDGKPSSEDVASWFKNFTRAQSMEKTTLKVTESVDVRTSYFSKVSLEAKYWLDKMDQAAVARVLIEEGD